MSRKWNISTLTTLVDFSANFVISESTSSFPQLINVITDLSETCLKLVSYEIFGFQFRVKSEVFSQIMWYMRHYIYSRTQINWKAHVYLEIQMSHLKQVSSDKTANAGLSRRKCSSINTRHCPNQRHARSPAEITRSYAASHVGIRWSVTLGASAHQAPAASTSNVTAPSERETDRSAIIAFPRSRNVAVVRSRAFTATYTPPHPWESCDKASFI